MRPDPADRTTIETVDAYLEEVGDPQPDDATAPDLVLRAVAGEATAREQLIELYLPLVVSLARQYRTEGLEFAELVQEGCVGLLRALARYDPGRGPFGAYASWWIRQALQEARSDFMRPYRIPPKALRQLAVLKSEHDRIYATEERRPTVAEVAARTGIDVQQADALVRADAHVRSLDEPLEDADGQVGVLGDLLEDPISADAFEDVLDAIVGERLRLLVGRLTDRERDILESRLGLDGHKVEPLAEIGARYGISAERVRQLEARALAKVRQGAERVEGRLDRHDSAHT